MKSFKLEVFVLSITIVMISCTKEFTPIEAIATDSYLVDDTVSEPYHFQSIADMKKALNEEMNIIGTKGPSNFISYAEAVMSAPDYYDNPNVIYSERFGQILNSQGEVFINNTCVKVCSFGVLYGRTNK